MSTTFTLTSKTRVDTFKDTVSINDVVRYEFDLTPWQEDNDTVTSVTWTVHEGSVGVSGQALASGVASALLTFTQAGKCLIGILITTANEKKKIWLSVRAKDLQSDMFDDYGLGDG